MAMQPCRCNQPGRWLGPRVGAGLRIMGLAIVGWLIVGRLATRPAQAELWAGASAVDVTPRQLPVIRNGGFLEATSDRISDPLYARCLVLAQDATPLALVVVDNCMLPRELCDQIKQQAATATGIASDRILISATHTHSAPSVMDFCLGSRADPAYTSYLPGRIVDALVQAQGRMQPARIGWAKVDAGQYTRCRRWIYRPDAMGTDPFGQVSIRANMHPGHEHPDVTGPSGPTDPELTLLSVQRANGQPLALLGNFSMHYFSGHAGISADYFGRYVFQLQQRLAADDDTFVAIMSQGTSGDLWWGDYSRPATENALEIDAFAQGLVDKSIAALEQINYQTTLPLMMRETRLTLARRVPDAARLAWAEQMRSRMGDRRPASQPEVYAEQAIYLHEHPTCEVVLQVIRIGDFGIATLPNEVYGLTGLKLKLQNPLAGLMTIELANGASGYIPPPEQHRLGGYNTWPARTAGLEEQAEPKLVEALLRMLEQVAQRPRRTYREVTGDYARVILDAAPQAYYRLAELSGPKGEDATEQGRHATLSGNFAFHLPGPASAAFAGDSTNRAVHCVGGRLEVPIQPQDRWSVEFWVWNGLRSDARDITGTLLSCGGDVLQVTGRADANPGCLAFGTHRGPRTLKRFGWHHVVFVRDADRAEVYLDGQRELLCLSLSPSDGQSPLVIGARDDNLANWEGRLDELAVYDRALDAAEVERHYAAAALPDPIAATRF